MTDSDSAARTIIISLIGGIVIFAFTTFYTDFLKHPRIDIMQPTSHRAASGYSQYRIDIKNSGGATANNLKVTLKSSSRMNVSVYPFYTENITTPRIMRSNITGWLIIPKNNESTWWVIDVKRLAPLSALAINATTKFNTTLTISATYDEGSKIQTFILSGESIQLDSKESSLDLTITVILGFAAGIAFFGGWLYLRIRENLHEKHKTDDRYDKLLPKIAHDMCQVLFYVDKKYTNTLSDKLWCVRLWEKEDEKARRELIQKDGRNDDEMYNLLEDFFGIIKTRDNGIKNNQFPKSLWGVNQALRELNVGLRDKIIEIFKRDMKEIKSVSDGTITLESTCNVHPETITIKKEPSPEQEQEQEKKFKKDFFEKYLQNRKTVEEFGDKEGILIGVVSAFIVLSILFGTVLSFYLKF